MTQVVAPPEMSDRWHMPGWMRDERVITAAILIAILLVALAVRVYRLPDLMVVGGDQARDLIVVKHMIDNAEPALQGPIASVGTFHRGPAYYYLLAGAYFLGGGDPLAGTLLSVVMDLAALVMVFVLARSVAGNTAGLVAASLYAIAPIVVLFARFQWNPQNMVFFGLLAVYAAMRISRADGRWLLVLAPAWLIAWQLHEPSYFLVPMLALVLIWKWRVWLTPRIVAGALALSAFVLLPFIAQQVRTRGEDVRAMLAYMIAAATGQEVPTTLNHGLPSAVDRITTALNWLRSALPSPGVVNLVLIALGLIGLAWLVNRAVRLRSAEATVLLLYCATPLMFAFWPAPLYSQYHLINFPIPLILAGMGFAATARFARDLTRRVGQPRLAPIGVASGAAAIAMLVVAVATGSLSATAAVQPIPQRWTNVVGVTRQVIADANGRPFALRVLADYEYHNGYFPEWLYAFEYAGTTGDPLRVDLPTYVIFDPPDYEGGAAFGGHVVDGIRWVAFPAPSVEAQVLSDDWRLGGTGTGEVIGTTSPSSIHLTTQDRRTYSEALQTVPITELTRYMVRYEYRTDAAYGFISVYLQVFDANGKLLTTLPTGGGDSHGRRDESTIASFIGEVPAGAATGMVIVRWRGAGEAWFSNVELREVTSEPPW